jgi:hypothetical protein
MQASSQTCLPVSLQWHLFGVWDFQTFETKTYRTSPVLSNQGEHPLQSFFSMLRHFPEIFRTGETGT